MKELGLDAEGLTETVFELGDFFFYPLSVSLMPV
jgi:hypothetical protein